jgi:hypothetical protein
MLAESVEVPGWALTVGGWSVGVGAILAALIKLVPRVRELYLRMRGAFTSVDAEVKAQADMRASLQSIRRVTAIKAVLDRWVIRKGAQRCLLLTANNGGNEWRAGGPLYVSNPAQSVGPGVPNTWQEWQTWRCDAWYVAFLGRLLETYDARRGMLLVTGVDVEGELGTAYANQGTVASVVLPFKWVSGAVLWYVSINFGRPLGDPAEGIEDEERKAFIAEAREVFNDSGRCRKLIDDLRAAFDAVR